MQRFNDWLLHRQALLGLARPAELAEAALLPVETIESILRTGSLRGVSRSARGWLARSLKVTLRELEALAAGRVEWIDDARQVDLDRLTPDPLRVWPGSRVADALPPESQPCESKHGIPIVGRVRPGGIAEFLDDGPVPNTDAHRLPLRYPAAPDAFALRTSHPIGSWPAAIALVFRAAPPGQLRAGEAALLTRADRDGESVVCRVREIAGQRAAAAPLDPDEAAPGFWVDLEQIVRAARVLGAHPINSMHNSEG